MANLSLSIASSNTLSQYRYPDVIGTNMDDRTYRQSGDDVIARLGVLTERVRSEIQPKEGFGNLHWTVAVDPNVRRDI